MLRERLIEGIKQRLSPKWKARLRPIVYGAWRSWRPSRFPSISASRDRRIARFEFEPALAAKIRAARRCFIIGMGPSLAKIDPEALKDELVIGVNYVLRTEIKPDLMCVVDNRRVDAENLLKSKVKLITVRQVQETHPELFERLNAYGDIDFVDYGTLRRTCLDTDGFDPHLERVFWGGSVITDLAIPLSAYLGIRDIYIVGLDGFEMSFPSTHVWGQDAEAGPAVSPLLMHLHEQVGRLAEKAGSRVFNASPGGYVSAFKKIDPVEHGLAIYRTQCRTDLHDRFIVVEEEVCQFSRGTLGNNTWQIKELASGKSMRCARKWVTFENNDGSEGFEKTTHFTAEPSFVNPDWITLRPHKYPQLCICCYDSPNKYRARRLSFFFSPYFSSFKVFSTIETARARALSNRDLFALRKAVSDWGNTVIQSDRRENVVVPESSSNPDPVFQTPGRD